MLEANIYFVTFSPKILYIYQQLRRKKRQNSFNASHFGVS